MFLVHPTLKNEEVEKTCDVLRDVMMIGAAMMDRAEGKAALAGEPLDL